MCKSNGVMRAVSDGGECMKSKRITLWTYMSTGHVQDLAAVNVSSRWWTTFFCINTLFCNTHSFKVLVQNSWWPPIIHFTSSIGIGLSPHASQTMRRKGRRPAHLLALLGLLCIPPLLSRALSFINASRFGERTGGSEMSGMREHALTYHYDPNMILYI